jgi:hypothetical protein
MKNKKLKEAVAESLIDKKLKRYYISIDLNEAGIEAESEDQALTEANRQIKEGSYTLNIVDEEEI